MRKMLLFKKSFLIVFLLSTYTISFSQVTEKWVKRENGDPNSPDAANGLVIDNNCNVYVTGRSLGKGTRFDYSTIRYNADGDKKWEKRYNGPGNGDDEAVAIAADHKGNVYVTGSSTGNGTSRDYTTIKYSDDGDTKWIKRYNGPDNGEDEATAIAVDCKGNVYITGWSAGYTTIKYNEDGDTQWVRTYSGPMSPLQHAATIAVDNDGNVYVTGSDFTTIKYNKDGDIKWVQMFKGPVNGFDRADAVAFDNVGNVYVTGMITTFIDEEEGLNFTDIATVKYNANGVLQWAGYYNRQSYDEGKAIAVDSSGNVFITGVSGGADETFTSSFVTVKYNIAGIQQWAETVTPTGHGHEAEVHGLTLDAAGNVYVTGGAENETFHDYVTISYNTNGMLRWRAIYNGPGDESDIATAIGMDKNGNVYVTGRSSITQDDYATIKYNEAGVQKWVKRFNGPGDLNKGGIDEAAALAVDRDGYVYVTGTMTRNNTGPDYTTFKYDKNGDRIWKKTYNGPGIGPDHAGKLAVDAKGNVFVTGRSIGKGTGEDYATIRYDKDGDTKWVKRYNGPGDSTDQPSSIAVDENGFVYVTGWSTGTGTGSDYATIKYDRDGNVKWIKRYNGPGNGDDEATAIAVDAAGNVYVTGSSTGIGTGSDYATIKYDANGNELWVARYNGPLNIYDDNATALALDANGNVYVTGESWGTLSSLTDYTTIKYTAAGVQQWVARYNGPGNYIDHPNALAVDAFGNLYVTGQSYGIATSFDYATVKYNAAGVQQWVTRYNGQGSSYDGAIAIALDASANVYVTGTFATVKYNTEGLQQWEARYPGDAAFAIAVDDNNNVYVTGRSFGIGTSYDYATIKYEQTTLLTRSPTLPEQNNAVIVEEGSAKLSVKAFPNAFTDYINLQWSGNDKPVSITITDAMGRLVEKRTGLASSGTLKTGDNFPQGIYFAEIVQGPDKIVLKLMKR